MGTTDCFFDRQTEVSKVKADIVSKYFTGWSYVITAQRNVTKLAYIDLFSGPGRYKDGSPSTPLLILEKAINHPKTCQKVQFIFNDADPNNVTLLHNEVKSFPGINKLRYAPVIDNVEIGEETAKAFENMSKVPTLSFVDPWGYKGLSLPLIRALVKDWGCDSVFFFNYRRVNPGIENEVLEEPISLLFTKEVLFELREKVYGQKPAVREKIIIKQIAQTFKDWGMEFVLPFPFKSKSGCRTTHYLIFVSKHIRGYEIMKGIMGAASSSECQGVPSFEYNPAAVTASLPLFELEKPLDDLMGILLEDFAGLTLSMEMVYSRHHVGTPYLEKNYRKALLELEKTQKIVTNRTQRKARKGSFPKDMLITFPAR